MKDIWEEQHMAISSFRGAHIGYFSLILQMWDAKKDQKGSRWCCSLTQKRAGVQSALMNHLRPVLLHVY